MARLMVLDVTPPILAASETDSQTGKSTSISNKDEASLSLEDFLDFWLCFSELAIIYEFKSTNMWTIIYINS